MFFPSRRAILVHCLAGNYYFIENEPKKVEPSNLFRFLSILPKVISESFTYLPPEEARRRLTILYRLLYPYPGEMPALARAVELHGGRVESTLTHPDRPTRDGATEAFHICFGGVVPSPSLSSGQVPPP